jgi:hypothetical protein
VDKRLDQIKEGAGLEESRINEELVEFLKKHSDKFTLVILIAAIAIVGQKWLHQYQVGARNDAWAEYSEAAIIGPQNLVDVARKHDGRPGLRLQALSDAADMYLDFVRLDLKEVVAINAMTQPGAIWSTQYTEADKLNADEREAYLKAADDLYAQVIDEAGADESKRLFVLSGLFGRAAVAEERGEVAVAEDLYERIKAEAGDLFPVLAAQAELRLASVGDLSSVVMPIVEPAVELPAGFNLPGDGTGLDSTGSFLDDMLNQGGITTDLPVAPPADDSPADEPPADAGDEPVEEPGDDTGGDAGGEETGSDGSGA